MEGERGREGEREKRERERKEEERERESALLGAIGARICCSETASLKFISVAELKFVVGKAACFVR